MEKETEENTNTNEGETLLKEIELNFKQIKRNAPEEISDKIQTYYDQFITLTKGSEKDHIYDNLKILNTIVNNTSDTLKSIEDLPKKVRNYLSQLKMALYQLNSLRNIPSLITKIYKSGKYEGEYLHGKREGKGKYKYNNGDIYEGDYKNDLKEGKGEYKYNNGDIYIGEYKNGLFDGKGKYEYADGDIYEGDYKEDLRDGEGIYIYNNWNKYEGQWLKGLKHGKGTFSYEDGSKFVGNYSNGKKKWKR
jgi:hypothetical protein